MADSAANWVVVRLLSWPVVKDLTWLADKAAICAVPSLTRSSVAKPLSWLLPMDWICLLVRWPICPVVRACRVAVDSLANAPSLIDDKAVEVRPATWVELSALSWVAENALT